MLCVCALACDDTLTRCALSRVLLYVAHLRDVFMTSYAEQDNADEFTKHHPTIHHRTTRNRYVRDAIAYLSTSIQSLNNCSPLPFAAPVSPLQGCVV